MSPVTLIVHGTFAADATWWRLGVDSETTFADCLETELSSRGLSGTVWKPALAAGFDYGSFAWSGRNRHRDRLKGARRLSSSLNQLAQHLGATPTEPLTVNLVAHSHGGNVVLEALRRLKPNVRVGQIVLLGTPLVTVRPTFRLGRSILSSAILLLFFLVLFLLIIELGTLLFTGHWFDAPREYGQNGQVLRDGFRGSQLVAILFPVLLLYGWLFWLLGNFLDVAWRLLCRVCEPLAWVRGKARSLVYGPSPRKLAKRLRGRPILLLTCYNDEADLLLQVGSAPARLYREYVATEFSAVGRALEFTLLRPFVLGIFLKAAEMLLQVFALGFSAWRCLGLDFEVVPLDQRPYYPRSLLVRQAVPPARTDLPTARLSDKASPGGSLKGTVGQPRSLRVSIAEVIAELQQQIRLRHSSYYTNPAVIGRLGEVLTGGEVRAVETTGPLMSLKPSENFWEALFFGNIAFTMLYALIAGSAVPAFWPYFLGLDGYIVPFLVLGIILLFYWALRRRMPAKLWLWFWVVWAVGGLLTLSVLGLHRLGALPP